MNMAKKLGFSEECIDDVRICYKNIKVPYFKQLAPCIHAYTRQLCGAYNQQLASCMLESGLLSVAT